jgi:hypothetical protein
VPEVTVSSPSDPVGVVPGPLNQQFLNVIVAAAFVIPAGTVGETTLKGISASVIVAPATISDALAVLLVTPVSKPVVLGVGLSTPDTRVLRSTPIVAVAVADAVFPDLSITTAVTVRLVMRLL